MEEDEQDAIDWKAFALRFEKEEGFEPSPRDSMAKKLYKYYSMGAHDEHTGKLNS